MREGWERCTPPLKAGLAKLGITYFKELGESGIE